MTDIGSDPFTATNETLTDGSGARYVLRYNTRENIASASSEAAVADPDMRLSAVCEESAEESPRPQHHRSGLNGVDPATSDREIKMTRKHKHLRVPVLPDEEERIARNARAANLPVAVFLRSIGQESEARSILDNRRVEELSRINGNLGRLGGC